MMNVRGKKSLLLEQKAIILQWITYNFSEESLWDWLYGPSYLCTNFVACFILCEPVPAFIGLVKSLQSRPSVDINSRDILARWEQNRLTNICLKQCLTLQLLRNLMFMWFNVWMQKLTKYGQVTRSLYSFWQELHLNSHFAFNIQGHLSLDWFLEFKVSWNLRGSGQIL